MTRTMHRLRYCVIGTAVAALTLATTALGGSGVGGAFNLGQVNSVDGTTSLTGTTAGPQLQVTNHSTAASVFSIYGVIGPTTPGAGSTAVRGHNRGTGTAGYGVYGSHAGEGIGVYGTAATGAGIGVLGRHFGSTGSGPGVKGVNSSPTGAGVLGLNTGGGPGLSAVVNSGVAPLSVNSTHVVPNLHAANSDQLGGKAPSGYWQLGGNAPGSTAVLGTTDNTALELQVNGTLAFRLEPNATSPNLVGGAPANTVAAGQYGSVIAGGGTNDPGGVNHAEAPYDFIGAGYGNQAGSSGGPGASGVVAGTGNVAGGGRAFVGAGEGNTASGYGSAVGGGGSNMASGYDSAVGGGFGNTASGNYSAVGGGIFNHATGGGSTVPGGGSNTAGGNWSFAAGRNASPSDDGSFVWSDASGHALSSNGENTVSFASTGGARFVTGYDGNGVPNAGVTLAAGGGSWSSLSDRAAKRNLVPVDQRALLRKLNRVPISRWSYKAQQPSIRHLGPMAQDFHAAFALGEDNRHIDAIDSEGVALAAIQGLYRQNQALKRQNASLSTRLARLERLMERKR
jgi:hypothetical protein